MFCWCPCFRCRILWSSRFIIHSEVEPGGDDSNFLCSLLYGPMLWKEKAKFWCDLQNLNNDDNMPWVCLGDFNAIASQMKKQGGRAVSSSSSRGLVHFMQTMGFLDLGFMGSKFTWCNKRLGFANIRERLDRDISNIPWRLAYPEATICHYPITSSDHTLWSSPCSVWRRELQSHLNLWRFG